MVGQPNEEHAPGRRLQSHGREADDAAAEERIVAPRAIEPGLVRVIRRGVEEGHLDRVLPIRNAQHAQAGAVVGLVHQVTDDVQVVVGGLGSA